jgi:hypothetical protein
MDYLLMVPFAGVIAFDRMAHAAAEMGERWRKFVSHRVQRFFPPNPSVRVIPAAPHTFSSNH